MPFLLMRSFIGMFYLWIAKETCTIFVNHASIKLRKKTYAPSKRAAKYIKQTLTEMKGEIHKNTIMVGDFDRYFYNE